MHIYQQLNLKNIDNKQNRNRLIDKENILTVTRWEGLGEMGEKGDGINKYKLVVTE